MNNIILKAILNDVALSGGTAYYVGGYVRDKMLGIDSKDIDIEVFGITPDLFKNILSQYGHIDEIGMSFGIIKLRGLDVDFSMPRKENKSGGGHKGFDIEVNPFMSTKEASRRRDFTINSIMQNCITGEIVDHFGGIKDLSLGIIRHISDDTFVEDPLRVLRACQFTGRLNFVIAEDTKRLCKGLNIAELPKERVFEEIKKGLLKSQTPSVALNAMLELGVIGKLFPQMQKIVNCPQDPIHHPEGDVWTHTLMVVDQAKKHLSTVNDEKSKMVLMLGALLHDIGKPATTKVVDGKVTSYKHEVVGVDIALNVLRSLTTDKAIINGVACLVKNHMRPHQLNGDKALRRYVVDCGDLADMVVKLAIADYLGRKGHQNDCIANYQSTLDKISTLKNQVKPVVTGDDLLELGMKPGRSLGDMLRKLYEVQVSDGVTDKDRLLSLIPNL